MTCERAPWHSGCHVKRFGPAEGNNGVGAPGLSAAVVLMDSNRLTGSSAGGGTRTTLRAVRHPFFFFLSAQEQFASLFFSSLK